MQQVNTVLDALKVQPLSNELTQSYFLRKFSAENLNNKKKPGSNSGLILEFRRSLSLRLSQHFHFGSNVTTVFFEISTRKLQTKVLFFSSSVDLSSHRVFKLVFTANKVPKRSPHTASVS